MYKSKSISRLRNDLSVLFCAGDFFSSPPQSAPDKKLGDEGRIKKEGMCVLERQKPARKLGEAFFVAGFLLLLTAGPLPNIQMRSPISQSVFIPLNRPRHSLLDDFVS